VSSSLVTLTICLEQNNESASIRVSSAQANLKDPDEGLDSNPVQDDVHTSDKNTAKRTTRHNAVERMNKAIRMLYDIISDHDAKFYRDLELPKLDPSEGLYEGILEMRRIIGKLSERSQPTEAPEKTVLSNFGHLLKNICKNGTPFLKIFLAVGVQGSAVITHPFTFTTKLYFQIPILNPYGLLCSGVSLLITVIRLYGTQILVHGNRFISENRFFNGTEEL
jgi:hypothetical protein